MISSIKPTTGSIISIHPPKVIIGRLWSSRKPIKIRFGGVPIGVNMPPTLAPYAVASKKRTFSRTFSLRNRATGISIRVIVVLERMELKSAEVTANA